MTHAMSVPAFPTVRTPADAPADRRPVLEQTRIGIGLVLLAASLALSLRAIQLSVHALRRELGNADADRADP